MFLFMGNSQSVQKINYEDMQNISSNTNNIIINTLAEHDQVCLIKNTLNIDDEINVLNSYMKRDKSIRIVVYGRNCNDESIYKKHRQLSELGFTNVSLYVGGMFEWLLLQDIYGEENFPTTTKETDILKYKPISLLNPRLIKFN